MTYMRSFTFLVIGCLVLAKAMEQWNLHKRIALQILMWIGSKPSW